MAAFAALTMAFVNRTLAGAHDFLDEFGNDISDEHQIVAPSSMELSALQCHAAPVFPLGFRSLLLFVG